MDELCTACLCAGRNLYFISETRFYNIYLQILNEIPVYDMSQVCIRVCWECHATLQRFHRFKRRAQRCYGELLLHLEQPSLKLPPTVPPSLQIQPISTTTYPQVKDEADLFAEYQAKFLPDVTNKPTYDLDIKSEVEEHSEEMFAHDLDIDQVKKTTGEVKAKRRTKDLKIKPTKRKKRKTKIKNKVKNQRRLSNDSFQLDNDVVDADSNDDELTVEGTVDAASGGSCTECSAEFVTQQELEMHQETQHVNTTNKGRRLSPVEGAEAVPKVRSRSPASLSERPQCGDCGKVFSSRKTYRYHRNVLHKGQNRHPCPRCGKVYQWKSNLGRHMRSHKARDSGELYCAVCDKRFASVATYRQHLRGARRHVSETDYSFMCNECGKKFVSKTRLRDHIDWEHLKKIKFQCQLCKKAFKSHTSIYVHMKNVHQTKDKKDNLCHVCGKSYQNAAKLRYHIVAMHTSETPYQCEQCSAAFGWYSSLYRHVREVHYKMKLQPNRKAKKSKKLSEQLPPLVAPHHPLPLHPLQPSI